MSTGVGMQRESRRHGAAHGSMFRAIALLIPMLAVARPAAARQSQVLSQANQTIRVERGKTAILRLGYEASRISVADPEVADLVQPTSGGQPQRREFLINGLKVGTTSLVVWNSANVPEIYDIEVVVDATALETQLQTVFPNSGITITSSGQAVIVSGTIRDPIMARRALDLASQTGAQVIDNLQAPPQRQIMLKVRFAEIRRNARTRLSTDLVADNVGDINNAFSQGSRARIETLSDGLADLLLIGSDAQFELFMNALKSNGEFRSLAEPNLMTIEGKEASFLAGGEFPYPVVQQGGGGGTSSPVTIQFKEFGVRLTFTPTVTNSGSIRLAVEPEVSQLDFANGVTFSGFQVPSLLTRRAKTEVELNPGQHLALAGLMDNSMQNTVDKIPFLGDLPIIGTFFRSTSDQQARTELLVIVTPLIVEPTNTPPALPTGEPMMWKWDRHMRIDTTAAARSGGGGQ